MGGGSGKNAYQRGIRAAGLWKRFYTQIKHQDSRCVSWACNHKLPAWTGHIPIIGLMLVICGATVFGSLIVAGCLIFIWAIAYIIQSISNNSSENHDDNVYNTQGNDFIQDNDFLTNSSLNGDYDRPYTPPEED